jgi:hypothetical protein
MALSGPLGADGRVVAEIEDRFAQPELSRTELASQLFSAVGAAAIYSERAKARAARAPRA